MGVFALRQPAAAQAPVVQGMVGDGVAQVAHQHAERDGVAAPQAHGPHGWKPYQQTEQRCAQCDGRTEQRQRALVVLPVPALAWGAVRAAQSGAARTRPDSRPAIPAPPAPCRWEHAGPARRPARARRCRREKSLRGRRRCWVRSTTKTCKVLGVGPDSGQKRDGGHSAAARLFAVAHAAGRRLCAKTHIRRILHWVVPKWPHLLFTGRKSRTRKPLDEHHRRPIEPPAAGLAACA
jgi:hypothetical protein